MPVAEIIKGTIIGEIKIAVIALLNGTWLWLNPIAARVPRDTEMIVATGAINNEFLKEGENVEVLFHADEGKPLSASLPPHLILEISETEPGIKGNTATNTFKPAKTETGAEVQVPLFINVGDKIKIDTEKKTYIERVKWKHIILVLGLVFYLNL